jgi:ubiquinone/menaquinone biosynthesis C-methylase UbiE
LIRRKWAVPDNPGGRHAPSFLTDPDRYDAWYDSHKGRVLLASEVACLRPLLLRFSKPYLEVGVGTGRFAEALAIGYGVDPSPPVLEKARQRDIKVVLGMGEALPFKNARFGAVLMAFALCFVKDPPTVMREIHRVLVAGGGLILGLLLKGTPWADLYEERGRAGDPLFRTAHFHSRGEVETLLKESRFQIAGYRSTLFQPPGREAYHFEESIDDYVPGAGFVAVAAVKDGKSLSLSGPRAGQEEKPGGPEAPGPVPRLLRQVRVREGVESPDPGQGAGARGSALAPAKGCPIDRGLLACGTRKWCGTI